MDQIELKRRYKKIIVNLFKIDTNILVDTMADLYDDKAIDNDFGEFVNNTSVNNKNNIAFVALMAMIIYKREGSWMKIFGKVIKRATKYIETTNYINESDEYLKKEFSKNTAIAIYKTGIAPELLILYLYAHNNFNSPRIPFLTEQYKIKNKQITEECTSNIKGIREIRLDAKNEGSILEHQINEFIVERNIKNFPTEDVFEELAEKYHFVYNKQKQTMQIARGLAWFLMDRINSNIDHEKLNNNTYHILSRNIALFNKHIQNYKTLLDDLQRLKRENKSLKKKNTASERQVTQLKYIEDTQSSNNAFEKENNSLKKELHYAKTRIEQLEQEIAELEDEKEINKQIQNDILIVPEAKEESIDLPEFATIVVSGGKWDKKTKNQTKKLFAANNSSVVFVDSNETIRKQDTIRNADLVIFDTSRHAHKYYYKIKELNVNILHINKSNVENLRKLFVSS